MQKSLLPKEILDRNPNRTWHSNLWILSQKRYLSILQNIWITSAELRLFIGDFAPLGIKKVFYVWIKCICYHWNYCETNRCIYPKYDKSIRVRSLKLHTCAETFIQMCTKEHGSPSSRFLSHVCPWGDSIKVRVHSLGQNT